MKTDKIDVANAIDAAAQAAHETNRAYCEACGDLSQPPWAKAPDWQRESAENGVRMILANPESPPSASHENWLKEKIDAGWSYGPIKDLEKKKHPCCVPYEDLPDEQKAKDLIFGTVVRAVLAARGLIPFQTI